MNKLPCLFFSCCAATAAFVLADVTAVANRAAHGQFSGNSRSNGQSGEDLSGGVILTLDL